MTTLRFALIRLLVRLIDLFSSDMADPADVTFCYRLLLGRAPDAPGWQHHMAFILPERPRATLVESFLNCNEFQALHSRSTMTMVDTGRFIMAVDSQDHHIAPAILGGHGYEPHVTAALLRELRPDSVFVDLGANMGWFTLNAAAVARQGQIVAIEPNTNNVQLLYHSLLANHFDNVRVLPYAVSDRPTRLRLSFFHSNGYVGALDDAGQATTIVDGLPLDDLLGEMERIDVLKIDIEGYEPIALRGMTTTLRRCRPVLLCEFHPAMIRAHAGIEPAGFLKALGALGYGLRIIHDDGTESAELDSAGVLAEWQRRERAMNADGQSHVDLIGRPRSAGA